MLSSEVTVEQEKLIIAVAKRCISLCSCYGHLCGYCKDAKMLLGICGVKHHHVRGEDVDKCEDCGRDLRDSIHF